MMEFDDKEFKRKFPHLYEELENSTTGESEDTESPEVQDAGPDASEMYPGDAISYIRRARTNEEATEVVNYLRKRGELSESDASRIIKQIRDQGVRSFGGLKMWGHYERELRKKNVVDVEEEEEVEEESD
jgi:hypothetical protein